MGDERDKTRPPKHDRLSGAVDESIDSDDITDRFHALEETPVIRAAFLRIQRRSEGIATTHDRDRAELLEVIKLVRDRTHDLAGDIAKIVGQNETHHQVDEERFSHMESAMIERESRRDEVIGEVKAQIKDRDKGSGKWLAIFLGLAVSIGGAVITSWIVMSNRVQRVEDRLDAAKDATRLHDDQVDRTLDRLDSRLDAIGIRLGVPQPTP